MEITKSVTFDFYGKIMQAFLTDEGKFILPMYELCGILGLSTSAQVQRIKRDPTFSDALFYVRTMVERPIGSLQTRSIACLWLNYLPYWLGYINARSVKPELREKVSKVKVDLAEITWSVYCDHILPPDVLAKISAQTE